MKAVVLAGGFGTRLRPLTCTRPKLLVPVLNQPLLDWTLKGLAKEEIDEVILAVNYMAQAFMNHYGKSKYGMKIRYSREEKPLGTGGPIKKAETLIDHNEPFLVLNGDILANISYGQLARTHEENRAVATVALHQVDDPSRYGTVELTENHKITRFVEKPAQGEEPSNLVNAGIYVLDPTIFDYISSDQPVSIEREVFPELAKGGSLSGYVFEDIWLDIGEPASYFEANWVLLDRRSEAEFLGKNCKLGSNVKIVYPVNIAENVVVGEKAKIGPYTVLGENITIGKGVSIKNSIVFPETTVSDFTSIDNAIIGEHVTIGNHVKIKQECIVGDHVTIQDNTTLPRGVSICPHKKISENLLVNKCVM